MQKRADRLRRSATDTVGCFARRSMNSARGTKSSSDGSSADTFSRSGRPTIASISPNTDGGLKIFTTTSSPVRRGVKHAHRTAEEREHVARLVPLVEDRLARFVATERGRALDPFAHGGRKFGEDRVRLQHGRPLLQARGREKSTSG